MKTAFVLIAFLLGACVVQKAPVELDLKAKKLNPTDNNALVYVFRTGGFGSGLRGTIICDNNYLGSIGGLRYLYTFQEPKKHTFYGITENKSGLELVLEPGKTYYLQQRLRFGYFTARNRLVLLTDAEGKELLLLCKLSSDCSTAN